MKRARWVVALGLVAGAAACYTLTPPVARALPAAAGLRMPVRGAIHVHTRRSDGTGTVDEVAAAAARAGLGFVIFTDHGDDSREADPPTYRQGVLCIDAVEISTEGGHLIALGVARSGYPLAGEGRDVVEDVHRLGGIAIAAHPFSPKPELRWTDWSTPLDGLEWLNGDSEWRDEPVQSLARALLTYPQRRSATLGTLLDRPAQALQQWDRLAMSRPTVAVAAADAHARIGIFDREPYDSRIALPVPGYEQVFRTFSIALPDVSLTRNASTDARAVVDAIRQGHVFSTIDALATPAALSFEGASGSAQARMGDVLLTRGPVTFTVTTNAPQGATISLLRDGSPVTSVVAPSLTHHAMDAGAYRLEIHLPGAPGEPPVPWVVSNPVYVVPPRGASAPTLPVSIPTTADSRYADGPASGWRVESSSLSQGALDVVPAVGGTQLSLRYAVGGVESESSFVALVMPVPEGLSGSNRLEFVGRSSRATRIHVLLRAPGGSGGQRWHRSVFLDENARAVTVTFDDMRPSGTAQAQRPALAEVRDVLFVIDTVNTKHGTSGQLWLDDVRVGRSGPDRQ